MATPPGKPPRDGGSDDNQTSSESNFSGELARQPKFEYFGWVYHLGVNKIGREYCHLRFLYIRGKYVEMYKRDPHSNLGIKPIRRGTVGPTFRVEDTGRRRINDGDLYVLRFYNRLDESRKGEIACFTAGEAQKWMEAFDQAKQQAEYEILRGEGSARDKLNVENEIDLEGHRPRVRKYAHGLKKLIRIGQGHETLLSQWSGLPGADRSNKYIEADGDVVDAHKWKCVCTLGGIRIFEDVADLKSGKGVLVKSVGVIDASADTVFEVLMSLQPSKRYEWDMVTSDIELIESLDGHYDVLYGTFDPKYFTWQWFRGQEDGIYTILHSPASHKKKPQRSGYKRQKTNPINFSPHNPCFVASSWEIKNLSTLSHSQSPKCLLTHMLEIDHSSWDKWKKYHNSKFEASIPFALLCQVAGLKEYIAANPSLNYDSHATIIDSKSSFSSVSNGEYDGTDMSDKFYDAISPESDDEDSDEETETDKEIDPLQFRGSLRQGKDDNDTNCWTEPGGMEFMIRGKTYLEDKAKVVGGDPLLKLVAVDWLKTENTLDKVALRPSCIVQSEAGKSLPFIFVVNLQVPATPNYNLVFYYAADRPIRKGSLLQRFMDGTDTFRDSRFKLIPSIVKGYWMVKRAVGTRACLLGKAVTCRYLRQDNFLEIDVDIGSSSVARGVIGLVLGYVTSLVVDLAILLEAKEESELPEYLLGTVRLNCLRLDSAEQNKSFP
ncbi:hypothetical protein V2J09_010365 [Rumex salicifolius]